VQRVQDAAVLAVGGLDERAEGRFGLGLLARLGGERADDDDLGRLGCCPFRAA
jgi:hypothetical protein